MPAGKMLLRANQRAEMDSGVGAEPVTGEGWTGDGWTGDAWEIGGFGAASLIVLVRMGSGTPIGPA
jgi:hypothetical protein